MTDSAASKTDQRIGVWVAIIVVTLTTSLALNIAHAFAYHPVNPPGGAVKLSEGGRVALALLSGILPVAMVGTLSHTLVARAPAPVRVVVVALFVIGLAMSTTAQYDMVLPVTGHARALGMVAIIDIPALIALYMIERAMRARRAAERAARERHERAERERRERLETERRERLERERRAAAEAERAAAERAAEAERAAAERERLAAERAERAAAAERERRERLAAEQEAAERERLERERRAAERRAAAELRERGDLTLEQKREIAARLLREDPEVTSTRVVAAVEAAGGQWSSPAARRVLKELRESSAPLAEVRSLRQTAAV